MGNVTFIIGNGFDLNLGLKTRYSDFYEKYIKDIQDDTETIKKFKNEIIEPKDPNWADFELGMGQKSNMFNSAKDFEICLNDFVVKFANYLTSESKKISWKEQSKNVNFNNSITNFHKQMENENSAKIINIAKKGGETTTNILQFNYTDVFDKLYQQNAYWGINGQIKGVNLHLHGHLHGHLDARYPAIGVNDVSQISNSQFHNNSDLLRIFIKQEYIKAQNSNANIKSPQDLAVEAIQSTDIFCAFGTSIGKTDKYWWKLIGERLQSTNDSYFIIFDKCFNLEEHGISPSAFNRDYNKMQAKKDMLINQFIEHAEIDKNWLESNNGRIIVELNTKMFDIKLPFITIDSLRNVSVKFEKKNRN